MTNDFRAPMAAFLCGALLVTLSSCAGGGVTPGDVMHDQAAGTESLGDQWNTGEWLAAKAAHDREEAERSIARAENALPEARQALDKANRDLEAAQRMMADAEAEYARRFPGRSLRKN